jgi:hypothetical protein
MKFNRTYIGDIIYCTRTKNSIEHFIKFNTHLGLINSILKHDRSTGIYIKLLGDNRSNYYV